MKISADTHECCTVTKWPLARFVLDLIRQLKRLVARQTVIVLFWLFFILIFIPVLYPWGLYLADYFGWLLFDKGVLLRIKLGFALFQLQCVLILKTFTYILVGLVLLVQYLDVWSDLILVVGLSNLLSIFRRKNTILFRKRVIFLPNILTVLILCAFQWIQIVYFFGNLLIQSV